MVCSTKMSRLGEVLIAKGLLSQDQLTTAINVQKSAASRDEPLLLGEVLIRLGYVNRDQLTLGLDWQAKLRRTSLALALCAPVMFFSNHLFANFLRDRPLTIEAEHFSLMQGVQVESTSDVHSDRNVGSISTNDWMQYSDIDITDTGSYRITLRIASLSGGGQLAIDTKNGRRIASVTIPKTNGWQQWQDVSVDVELTRDNHDLKFIALSGGFNLNWFRIESLDPDPISLFIKGSDYRDMRGIQLEACSDIGAGKNVSYIDTGDFMNYEFESSPLPVTATYQLTYRVAANKSGGQLQLRNPLTQEVFDSFIVPNTTGWQKWVDIVRQVELPMSTQQLQVYAASGGFNFNWMKIETIIKPFSPILRSNLPLTVPASQYSFMQGVQTEPTADIGGGNNVSYIHKDDWLLYGNHPLHIPYRGRYKLSFRVASLSEKGEFILVGQDGAPIKHVELPVTYGWQRWVTVEAIVELPEGKQFLDIRVTKGGFNFNWIRVEPVDTPTSIQILGADYSTMSGVQLQQTEDMGGGLNVAYVDPGDWLRFDHQSFIVPTAGKYKLTYRVASPSSGGTISLRTANSSDVFDISVVPITGGWQRWQNIEKVITLPAGNHQFSIHMVSGYYNFNWFSLEPLTENETPIAPPLFSSAASTSSRSSSNSLITTSSSSSFSSSSAASQSNVEPSPSTHHLAGTVGIRWFQPQSRQDGTPLDPTEIGGYRIRYKRVSDEAFIRVDIKDPLADHYELKNLPEGNYIIQIAAFDENGIFSPFADIQSVRITR